MDQKNGDNGVEIGRRKSGGCLPFRTAGSGCSDFRGGRISSTLPITKSDDREPCTPYPRGRRLLVIASCPRRTTADVHDDGRWFVRVFQLFVHSDNRNGHFSSRLSVLSGRPPPGHSRSQQIVPPKSFRVASHSTLNTTGTRTGI